MVVTMSRHGDVGNAATMLSAVMGSQLGCDEKRWKGALYMDKSFFLFDMQSDDRATVHPCSRLPDHQRNRQHSTIVIDEAHELSLNIEFLSPMGVDHIHNARNYCFQ
jgi:hypothetical protein